MMRKILKEWRNKMLNEEGQENALYERIIYDLEKLGKGERILRFVRGIPFRALSYPDGSFNKEKLYPLLDMIRDNYPKIFFALKENAVELNAFCTSLMLWIEENDHGKSVISHLEVFRGYLEHMNPIANVPRPEYLYRGLTVNLKKPGDKKVLYRDLDEKVASSWTPDIKVAKEFTASTTGCVIGINFEKFEEIDAILWEFAKKSELGRTHFISGYITEREWVYSVMSPLVVDLYKAEGTVSENEDGFIQLPQDGEAVTIVNKKSG